MGEAFRLGESWELELVEALRLPGTAVRTGRTPSHCCSAPRESGIGQGMARLEHGRLGVLELFLVPVGATPGGTLLEAVFN